MSKEAHFWNPLRPETHPRWAGEYSDRIPQPVKPRKVRHHRHKKRKK